MPKKAGGQSCERQDQIDETVERAPYSQLATALGAREADKTEYNRVLSEIAAEMAAKAEAAGEEGITLEEFLQAELPKAIKGRMKRIRKAVKQTSMLDEPTLGLTADTEITNFLDTLGIDLDNPEDFKHAQDVFAESLMFLHVFFANNTEHGLSGNLHKGISNLLKSKKNEDLVRSYMLVSDQHKIEHPKSFQPNILEKEKKLLEAVKSKITKEDILKFFKCSAGDCENYTDLISHACALLRSAYVINYAKTDPLISALPHALAEIACRKRKHFTSDRGKQMYKTMPGVIELVSVEDRTKTRYRIYSKLLHKPGNSSEKVLDHIGLKITTRKPLDTLNLIFRMFIDPKTAMFPGVSVRSDETTNLIIDEELLSDPVKAREFVEKASKVTINHEEITDITAEGLSTSNKHSSRFYKSIHLIVDLPVKLPDGRRINFPIEIQILDIESSIMNEKKANHGEYVEKQDKAVLGRLTDKTAEPKKSSKKSKRKSREVSTKVRKKARVPHKKTPGKTARVKK